MGIHVKLGNWANLREEGKQGATVGDRLASASVAEREFILQSRKDIHMPLDAPPMMFEWAELVGHKLRKLRGIDDVAKVKYMLVTDAPVVVTMARERFGEEQLLVTEGNAEAPAFSDAGRMKAALDLWLLSQADAMVMGRSTAFADKAQSLAMHTQVRESV